MLFMLMYLSIYFSGPKSNMIHFNRLFTTATGLLLLAAYFNGASADDIDFKNKAGSKLCVGKICDDSTAFYYYECCGNMFDQCCFKLQTWVLIVLIVVGCFFVLSLVGGFLRCIFCSNR
uniref:Uncharacterized protein n=1 Tax=Panagrolaimus sp. JU765 TaxID=591449 RepID=A0AC34RJN1_9BILA